MTRNLGQFDRLARILLGAALMILAFMGSIGPWGYLGVIFVGTAFVSFCPVYKVLGLKTCTDC